ncbi:hypothetical protein [Nonomuraea maritima]
MTAQPDQEQALAAFCAAVPHLRTLLRGPASAGRRALMAQVLRAARRGEPVGALLDQLGIDTVPAAEEVDTRSALPTPVDGERRPITGVYVCPKETCTRVVHREADAEVPSCEIHEQALRFSAEG